MGLSAILEGHKNEVLGRNEELSQERMKICKTCPLYKEAYFMGADVGPVCNSKLWLNLKTGETSPVKQIGWKNGCGCRLSAKTTLPYASCPVGKW